MLSVNYQANVIVVVPGTDEITSRTACTRTYT